jgi:uncharacterized paraquat-inducible protein A
MITLHSAPDAQEASLLVLELRANGVDAEAVHDANAVAFGRTSASVLYVQVQVPRTQLEAARSVLARFLEPQKTDDARTSTPWTCAGCGESNEPTFDVCWSCQAVAPSAK